VEETLNELILARVLSALAVSLVGELLHLEFSRRRELVVVVGGDLGERRSSSSFVVFSLLPASKVKRGARGRTHAHAVADGRDRGRVKRERREVRFGRSTTS